jgi:O-methyltransferase
MAAVTPTAPDRGPHARYLELLAKVLTRYAIPRSTRPIGQTGGTSPRLRAGYAVQRQLRRRGYELHRVERPDLDLRVDGRDWPAEAETMVGLKRLYNVWECAREVLADAVPGDFIETGVWRGGTTIFMRALLEAYGDPDRRVWVADSFEGLPPPDPRYPADAGDEHFKLDDVLAVSLDDVRANFARFDLLDDRVRFLKGYFKDSLPDAPIGSLALLRLDGDLYQSTWEALTALYPKVSPGGFVIVDDFGAIPACAKAVEDYRSDHGINEPMTTVDWTGVYWRKAD